MRLIASALLIFTLAACSPPDETETNAAPEPVTSEESVTTGQVSAQACVKRCSSGLYAGQTCRDDSNCGKTCSGGLYAGQACSGIYTCGKTCSGGANAGMACSSDANCAGWRCVTHVCAAHRCVTYCN